MSAGSDDAEERSPGSISLTSSDLEFVFDQGGNQTTGSRFNGIDVPQGATILEAYVQFQVDEPNSVVTSLNIQGEDVDNAATFTSTSLNMPSARCRAPP